MIDLERIKEGAAAAVNTAAKTGAQLYHQGRRQVDKMALETKLARAQRQLGALVYTLHKNNEENPQLVARYLETIAGVERELAATNTQQTPPAATEQAAMILCPQCGAEMDGDAIFCPECGNKM